MSKIDVYEHGVSVVYRVNTDNEEETIALIGLNDESKNVYRTVRGAQVGDQKSDILTMYGEKYPTSTNDMSYTYMYDLKNKKFMNTSASGEKEDAYEQIGADFLFNEEGYVERIWLFDMHMGVYMQ